MKVPVRDALRTSGRVALRMLLPFPAMRKTMVHAKKEMARTREGLGMLKQLGIQAKDVAGRRPRVRHGQFAEVMHARSTDALSQEGLVRFFLRRKRLVLGSATIFAMASVYAFINCLLHGKHGGMLMAVVSLASSLPVFFTLALGSQLRLWQLTTKRLSAEEHGSLQDFMREVPHWWWVTLDPRQDMLLVKKGLK